VPDDSRVVSSLDMASLLPVSALLRPVRPARLADLLQS